MQLEGRAISPGDGSGDSGLRSVAGLCVGVWGGVQEALAIRAIRCSR